MGSQERAHPTYGQGSSSTPVSSQHNDPQSGNDKNNVNNIGTTFTTFDISTLNLI
jgi:hypothetical protein